MIRLMPISGVIDIPEFYDNIVLDLWSNSERMKDSFGGLPYCKHSFVEKNICKSCGAYVGLLGQEPDTVDFYKHVYLLVNKLPSKNIYIISNRPYDVDYKFKPFSMKFDVGVKLPYSSLYTIHTSIVKEGQQHLDKVSQNNYHVIHFTSDKTKLWRNKVIYSPKMNLSSFLSGSTLVVNPCFSYLRSNFSHSFDWVTPNSEVYDTLNKGMTLWK